MTRRDRVICALSHKESDFVPFNADFTQQEYEKMVAFTNDNNFLDQYDVHLHYFQYWGYPTEMKTKKDHFLDEFGVVWNRSGADKDIGVVDNPSITEPDISLYVQPKFDEKRLRNQIESHIKDKKDMFCFAGIGFSMFERLWSYCGMEDALCYMLTEPEFVEQLLNKICEHNLRVIDVLNEYELDAIYFGDDWGQQSGLIMGAPLWRKFIKPQMAKMYARVKSRGKYVMQHSCGDIAEIFPDLIEIGLDCYQTFQPEVYDIKKIKDTYGDKLTFWGGVSTQQLLPKGTKQEIEETIDNLIKILSKNGGYIIAPTHAIPFDVPEESVLVMLDKFQSFKK